MAEKTYTEAEVREAATNAAGRIISMVMWGCHRKKGLDGMPSVDGKPMAWEEYVAHRVCRELEDLTLPDASEDAA